MVSMGNLDAADAAKYEKKLPVFPVIPEVSNYGGQRGYLLNLVQQELQNLDFSDEEINGGGLKVVTTLDYGDAVAAAKAVDEQRPDGHPQLHVALSAVEPATGALRAMIGGRDYTGGGPKDQVNFATGADPGRVDDEGVRRRGGSRGRLHAARHLRRQLALHVPER